MSEPPGNVPLRLVAFLVSVGSWDALIRIMELYVLKRYIRLNIFSHTGVSGIYISIYHHIYLHAD